jgi:flagellar biosynthesis chaperone FliJ
MKSRIERQIYEKIKEYHYMEYNKMVYREEQKISDELANINHGRLERNLANEQY